jgi:hypothetical protein
MRGLWASVEINPKLMLRLNLAILLFLLPWTALLAVPGSPLVDLGASVTYVTFISHVALILSCMSTVQAAQVEIKQDQIEKARQDENSADLDEVERKVGEVHEAVTDDVS